MDFRITYFILFSTLLVVASCKRNENSGQIKKPTNKVLLSSEIVWEKLNPARGDQSPQAATLWGDRNGTEATGFLDRKSVV